jgi:hypothetical protein
LVPALGSTDSAADGSAFVGFMATVAESDFTDIMRTFVVITVLLPSLALAQSLPQPKPAGPGGSCPYGYTSSGSFCVPREGAQDAIPLTPNGICSHGWTRSGSFCLRTGRPSKPA